MVAYDSYIFTINSYNSNKKKLYAINTNSKTVAMRLLVTATILIFYSCKVTDTKLIGHYNSKSYHRSTIILDSSNQFNFWNDGLEFMLSNESFLCTQGTWTRTTENRLILNSISDSMPIPRIKTTKKALTGSDKSKFVFFDLNKDTVLMYMVNKNDKTVFWRSHGPYLTNFEDSINKSDTLLFTFTWGFKPIQIVIDSNEPTEYTITLNREFRPNYFRNSEFIIRRNKIIRTTDKTKFSKIKSNRI